MINRLATRATFQTATFVVATIARGNLLTNRLPSTDISGDCAVPCFGFVAVLQSDALSFHLPRNHLFVGFRSLFLIRCQDFIIDNALSCARYFFFEAQLYLFFVRNRNPEILCNFVLIGHAHLVRHFLFGHDRNLNFNFFRAKILSFFVRDIIFIDRSRPGLVATLGNHTFLFFSPVTVDNFFHFSLLRNLAVFDNLSSTFFGYANDVRHRYLASLSFLFIIVFFASFPFWNLNDVFLCVGNTIRFVAEYRLLNDFLFRHLDSELLLYGHLIRHLFVRRKLLLFLLAHHNRKWLFDIDLIWLALVRHDLLFARLHNVQFVRHLAGDLRVLRSVACQFLESSFRSISNYISSPVASFPTWDHDGIRNTLRNTATTIFVIAYGFQSRSGNCGAQNCVIGSIAQQGYKDQASSSKKRIVPFGHRRKTKLEKLED